MREQEVKTVCRQLKLSKKVVNELTNSSTFERNIPSLIDIDIYGGLKALNGNKGNIEEAYKNTGIKYVAERIKHYLFETKIARNIFVEYSLVSSTLDPTDPDKLQCCSFIINKDNGFKTRIEKYYTSCIDKTENDLSISIYQHPEFIFNIDTKKNLYTISDSAKLKLRNHQISENFKPYTKIEDDNTYISSFKLERSFSEMTRTANQYKGGSLQYIQKYLHGCCHEKISMPEGRNSIYISFPIFGSKASNQVEKYKVGNGTPLQGIGACFIYFEPTDSFMGTDKYMEFVSVLTQKIVYEIGKIVRFISANYSFNLGLQLQENARKETIKSAVSAIMSRNMSHNLGSHYLYYTKAHLDNIAKDSEEIGPDIRGAAKVLGYIQARMDYLATVISNDKYPYGAVNFKSQIYDELTVDDFSSRHFHDKEKERTTNFLLTNLILSENFSRPNVLSGQMLNNELGKLFLHVKYSTEGKIYNKFTGTSLSRTDDRVLKTIKALNIIRKVLRENSEITVVQQKEIEEKFKSVGILAPTGLMSKASLSLFIDNYIKNNLITMDKELDIKNTLSSLNISLPGGTMSCHAFFNVVENFIRNSAKYSRNDFNKQEGLVCTIAIRPHANINKSECGEFIDLIIYDNKQNANPIINQEDLTKNSRNSISLFNLILEKLGSLKILNNDNSIAKENKGFKEMLFSAIWMRSYTFGDETYADIVSKINQDMSIQEKLSLIEKYGFTLVKVEDNGEIVNVYDRTKQFDKKCSLGIMITLPRFNKFQDFKLTGDAKVDVNNMLNTMADVVRVDTGFMNSEFNHVFTRPLLSPIQLESQKQPSEYEEFLSALQVRFPDIEEYALCLGEASEAIYNKNTKVDKKIYFKRHLSSQDEPDNYFKYAYADSISGGDFTVTLSDLFSKGLDSHGNYKTLQDKLFALRIKESALTRITIIDERLHKSSLTKFPWLSLKNVRVLNQNLIDEIISDSIRIIDERKDDWEKLYLIGIEEAILIALKDNKTNLNKKECVSSIISNVKSYVAQIVEHKDNQTRLSDNEKKNIGYKIASNISMFEAISTNMIFEGNTFRDSLDYSHFLTIHLGLLEKILKNSIIINFEIDRRLKLRGEDCLDWSKGDRLESKRVIEFMRMLREQYDNGSKKLYIAIHSGRGNYSAELEGPLARFPFISLSALESAFNNSKYQLSQLLYNTVYIGKGFANKK